MKKIGILFIVLFGIFIISNTVNAWENCDNNGNCIKCNPRVLTHCEPLAEENNDDYKDKDWCSKEPNDPDCMRKFGENYNYDNNSNTNNNSSSNNSITTNSSNSEKPAYLYIKYRDKAGRNISMVPTYKGTDGEIVDLSKYKKNISSFKFVKYEPESGKITLIGGKSLSVFLIYEKDYKENNFNSQSDYHKNLEKIKNDTKKVDKIDSKNSEYHKNLEKVKTNNKKVETVKQIKIKTIQNKLDSYFNRKKLSEDKKEILLSKLQVALYMIISKEENLRKKEMYKLLLEAIEDYE